jgi:RimJ/RimL family protein N-acetyltransferase
MTPFLIGEKVYLRAMERGDAQLIADWFNREPVRRGTRQYRPQSPEQRLEKLERISASEQDVQFGVALREGDRLIGACGLHSLDECHHHAELGMVIGDPVDWGHGYGADAARLLIGYGFDTLNLHRIWLTVYEDNPAARRIYERLGFRLEGTLRHHGFREGRWWDIHSMGLLADEWRQLAQS